MKTHIKTIYGTVILGACLLVAILFISQITKQLDSIVLSVQPSEQLAAVTPVATLSLSPSTSSISVGETFTVNILLNTGGQNAYGVDINRLLFTKNILEVVDVDSSVAGTQIAAGSLMLMTMANSVDNTAGTIQFSQVPWDQANNKPATFSNNNQGILATITFRAIAAGTANVNFEFTPGLGTDSNISGVSGDLLSSVGSGSYTVTTSTVTKPKRRIILVLEGTQNTKRDVSGTIEFLNPGNGSVIAEKSIVTDTSGQVIIDLPAGLLSRADIRPKIKGYLSRLVKNVDLGNTATTDVTFPILPSGDFDGNQIINSVDFSYMNTRWLTNDSLADINKDGSVNTLDFSYLSRNWLSVGE